VISVPNSEPDADTLGLLDYLQAIAAAITVSGG